MSRELRRESKLIASLAVFGVLHKSNKNIYEIIQEFIVEIIKSNRLYQFKAIEINELMYSTYEFEIPDAVIKTVLKKAEFLEAGKRAYTVIDTTMLESFSLEEQKNEQHEINNKFIYDLNSYIVAQKKIKLTASIKIEIIKAFTDFMLDNSISNEYSAYVQSFILLHKENETFVKNLQTVKEGVILYTGLSYNSNSASNWRNYLTIYLNTEILFHLADFDGEVQKLLFDDFYNLVKEVNREKKYISFKCLHQTKEEIEYFFNTATRIVEKKERLNNINNAMAEIVRGAKTTIDVLHKKTIFYNSLKAYGIEIEDEDETLYSEKNHQYCIFSAELIQKYKEKEENENTIKSYFDILNTINVKRAGLTSSSFEKSKFLLLTDNGKIRNISRDPDIRGEGNSLSHSLQYLTCRFWFFLNKGFRDASYPSTFNVITKAQILLGHHVKDKISKQYQECKSKNMNQVDAKAILSELRDRLKRSEKIEAEDVPLMIETIEEESIESYAKEHIEIKKRVLIESQEKAELKDKLDAVTSFSSSLEIKNEELRKSMISSKELSLSLLKEKEEKVLALSSKKYANFKMIIFFVPLIINLIIVLAIYRIGWDLLEPVTWIGTFVFINGLIYGYTVFYEKTFSILEILREKRDKIIKEVSEMEAFDYFEIEKLEEELVSLKITE